MQHSFYLSIKVPVEVKSQSQGQLPHKANLIVL